MSIAVPYHIIMPLIIFCIVFFTLSISISIWLTTDFILIFFIPLSQVYYPPKGIVARLVAWLVALKIFTRHGPSIWVSSFRGLLSIHHLLFSCYLVVFKSIITWLCFLSGHPLVYRCPRILTTIISPRRLISPSILQHKFSL